MKTTGVHANFSVEAQRKTGLRQSGTLILIVVAILGIFVGRTALAQRGNPPRLDEIFTIITLTGALALLVTGYRGLRRGDWIAAAGFGAVVGVSLPFTTLFSAYPFLGIDDNLGLAFVRGFSITLAMLGGQVIMRQGGPVQVLTAGGGWKKTARGILFGVATGLPLAVLNVFALQITQGHGIAWQNPLAALLDALQPGIVEEVIYRFALWGLLWLALRGALPAQAPFLAGLLATLVHGYGHFDELFLQAPLTALGMGLVMTLIWGLPMFYLARRRGLETAIAFHWIQDVARFLTGF